YPIRTRCLSNPQRARKENGLTNGFAWPRYAAMRQWDQSQAPRLHRLEIIDELETSAFLVGSVLEGVMLNEDQRNDWMLAAAMKQCAHAGTIRLIWMLRNANLKRSLVANVPVSARPLD